MNTSEAEKEWLRRICGGQTEVGPNPIPAKEAEHKPVIKKTSKGRGFGDIAGMNELKEFVTKGFINVLKNPKCAEVYGIKPPSMLFYGPAGCGKTHMMMQAARHLSRDFTITTAPQMPYDLAGFVDGHGRRVETAFTEAFTGGKVAGVDEGDRSSEDALIAVHAPIANRTMYLPGKGQTPAAEGFQVIMTMNTYGLGMDDDYNTAHQLDTATRDRLVFLPVDFDPRVDAEMCGGDADLFRFAQAWRRAVEEEEATHAVLSYRTVARLHSIAAHPRFGRIRALEIALVKGLPKHTLEGILNHLDGDNPWLTALQALERRMRE